MFHLLSRICGILMLSRRFVGTGLALSVLATKQISKYAEYAAINRFCSMCRTFRIVAEIVSLPLPPQFEGKTDDPVAELPVHFCQFCHKSRSFRFLTIDYRLDCLNRDDDTADNHANGENSPFRIRRLCQHFPSILGENWRKVVVVRSPVAKSAKIFIFPDSHFQLFHRLHHIRPPPILSGKSATAVHSAAAASLYSPLCVFVPLRLCVTLLSFVFHALSRSGMFGLPGLKCLRITSGSDELRLVICTPFCAAVADTKNSSSVISP
jgi:hypothetical protein